MPYLKLNAKKFCFTYIFTLNCDIGLRQAQLFFTKQNSKLLTLNESDYKNYFYGYGTQWLSLKYIF